MKNQNLPPEAELVKRLKNNDVALFEQVVKTYHSSMYAVAHAIAGPAIADEVLQEAWVSAINGIQKFEGRSALKSWLIRIVANEAKTRLRKESRSVSLEAIDEQWSTDSRFTPNGHWAQANPEWDISSPDELLAADELQECVKKQISNLPENQQQILNLRDVGGMDMGTICNILEISASNGRVLLHRARDKMQQVVARFQRTGKC
ncbi:RNA polymerase sigma factor [Kangiella sediminilitoris]|uniref:RNA polymerase, sigma-24 subunit, ECF subfamily n=1 Tax=Kangiella sediminilitoris TaxID=1144748 RepID=A0A1B3B820_9GAMM|nr:sigma-70 family RNA polymerase sigma factor [Kangiella sediminilitoris]AOE48938.1 RNA polymerase, sigma-24 subunit, ECF subfamily [Kangiella sediminilitoris]